MARMKIPGKKFEAEYIGGGIESRDDGAREMIAGNHVVAGMELAVLSAALL